MKVFGLLLLLLSATTSWATAETSSLEDLRTEQIQKLKDYQAKHPGWEAAPSDEYVAFFKKWNEDSLTKTLEYHQNKCKSDSSQCLSTKQERDLRSQYKVAIDTIERQNKLAKGSSGELVTKPGEFGGNRAPADSEVGTKAPPAVGPSKTLEQDIEAEINSLKPEEEKKPAEEEKTPAPEEKKPAEEEKTPASEEKKPAEEEKKAADEEKKIEEELEQFNDEEFPKNYDPQSCEWVEDMPRKIVYGPSYCSRQAVQICTGYVVCERKQGGGKFVRMSSCSPKNCGRSKEDAIACTLEQAFYSRRPEDERNHFVSPKLKKMLTTPKVRAQ